MTTFTRRDFGSRVAASAALGAAWMLTEAQAGKTPANSRPEPLYGISLAQWSLHRAFGRRGKATRDPMDFATISAQEFGITAVEYVSQFYASKKNDDATLKELLKRSQNAGVKNLLIMIDGEGGLGDADTKKRQQAVANHLRWLEWAKALGCHSIRVNAYSTGSYAEQVERAADGLSQLSQKAAPMGLNVIVENHGGLSSNGAWLSEVMKKVNLPNCGTLPDFGNFRLGTKDAKGQDEWYDRYQGVDEMMPFAKGVSAKSHEFNDQGDEVHTDYRKMLEIVVKKHKYRGFIGIEYEGDKHSEDEGIRLTKTLLEKVHQELAKA